MRAAFAAVTWSSRAASTSTSHGSSSSSAFVMRARRGSPRASRARATYSCSVGTSSPASVVDAARDVRDGDDRRALLVRARSPRSPPTLPKPWTTQRCSASVPAEPLARALDHHHDARAGRLVAEERAADRDRLAGDDLRHGVAHLHRVGVHHPGHRLLVRRHVGRGDVLLRADERRELGGEAARDRAASSRWRELARVAADAALRAAVRKPQQRALPGHPHRERGALAEADTPS